MTGIASAHSMGSAQEIVAAVRISDVYRALAGREPRSSGPNKWRAAAVWREGDGLNVSLDDARGLWHDFVTGQGGGVLDLVVQIRGGSRQNGLKWLADFAGINLTARPISSADRESWVKQKRKVESNLLVARLWRRTIVALGERRLETLKTSLEGSSKAGVDTNEIFELTSQVAHWRKLEGALLVQEFQWFREKNPRLTGAMVQVGKMRETAEWRAFLEFFVPKGKESP